MTAQYSQHSRYIFSEFGSREFFNMCIPSRVLIHREVAKVTLILPISNCFCMLQYCIDSDFSNQIIMSTSLSENLLISLDNSASWDDVVSLTFILLVLINFLNSWLFGFVLGTFGHSLSNCRQYDYFFN